MNDYVKRSDVINYVCQFCKDQHHDELCDEWDICQLFTRISNVPSADVIERDEGIKMGAELAAMHGSDATSQDLEKAYFKGMEEGYKKGRSGFEKHGKWKETDSHYGYYPIYSCSYCGIEIILKTKFCPNCGADMRDKNE